MQPTYLAGLAACLGVFTLCAGEDGLRLSAYATAGDVQRYMTNSEHREKVVNALLPLHISRLFLEGRRGDEYVAPGHLRQVRDFLAGKGIQTSGGIATVPGRNFGVRQNEGLGWLNWESDKTRHDVATFFAENASLFTELIVDDFFCTADTSPESARARGNKPWSEYRRDLLVSLIGPLMVQPVRSATRPVSLIIKFPQWYDRFHLFGYDPPRMAEFFDQVWVGTEVRNPKTRRMGFVQPTEGYVNFRWLASIASDKVRGAWFDHIECSPRNFLDQAYLSVLAGARELTLFRLDDLMEAHPGDTLLANRWSELRELERQVRGRPRRGIAFYKPPSSDAEENAYLADYLSMIGLPILPVASYPHYAKVAMLPVQASADSDVLRRMRRHLHNRVTLVLTPDFIRRAGAAAAVMAGVRVGQVSEPAAAREALVRRVRVPLPKLLDVDAGVQAVTGRTVIEVNAGGKLAPLLTSHRWGRGRVLVLNVRTFSDSDFRDAQEWLLAPKPRGLVEIPQQLADPLRDALLEPVGVRLAAPAGVALCLFSEANCLYNFLDAPAEVCLDGERFQLEAGRPVWRASIRSGKSSYGHTERATSARLSGSSDARMKTTSDSAGQ
jgi:hypothetical protein